MSSTIAQKFYEQCDRSIVDEIKNNRDEIIARQCKSCLLVTPKRNCTECKKEFWSVSRNPFCGPACKKAVDARVKK
jgi:hypothetical protein